MKKTLLLGILLAALALGTGCLDKADESHVYQGTCLALTDGGKALVLANSQPKLNPLKGDKAVFDISKAKVGLAPDLGNVIRVAFFVEKGQNVAIKVMNVSKQDLRKK
ncbi:MAG: hypothetical protein K9K65_05355 [Desulfarculaceae bacterium]|nr:hypothetical protein [Desulfarculaceae bacterium]MCF8047060.1 hypothetical protein [Desulfarculaceae bacterium]MCF8066632.1 hypothetical protein [Desulfarculaceae bacterium]MCF8097250.1 hypothetical protein [Desulfarculaceae bacterium]MCF8122143.1 hypothetical protein [Desulfarculaceae bacterium]